MYEACSRDTLETLKALSRSSTQLDSMASMINIYLNPFDDIMFSSQEKGPTYETSPENLRAAESLIVKL
jgi:hypothetical protein